MNVDIDSLRTQLNGETAKVDWEELLPFYAKGQLIRVDSSLDLIEIGTLVAGNQAEQIARLMQHGKLGKLDDATATDWQQRRPAIWATVLAPWILVQERSH